jgi:hypothetical protein
VRRVGSANALSATPSQVDVPPQVATERSAIAGPTTPASAAPALPPTPSSAPAAIDPAFNGVTPDVLRQRWTDLMQDLGRDLAAGNNLNVTGRMEQLQHLGAYIALLERQQRAARPWWQQWMFWRRIVLAAAVCATLILLFMALTHPSNVQARVDLLASSIAFTAQDDLRLPIGRDFQTISVTGLDRVEFPGDNGPEVVSGKGLTVSDDAESGGSLNWITIPRGARVRLEASGGEMVVSVATDAPAGATADAATVAAVPSIRWSLPSGSQIMITSDADPDLQEQLQVSGDPTSGVNVDGLCASNPARLEATIVLPNPDPTAAAEDSRLNRFSGLAITRLSCSESDLVTGETRSTLLQGRVSFPEIEIPVAQLDEGSRLSITDLRGSLVRVEMSPEGVHVVCEGTVNDIRAGRDEQRSLLPSRLESLFARRFRMYTAGVLAYALVFIIALLKGQPASLGDGFQPQKLMSMKMGGHLS